MGHKMGLMNTDDKANAIWDWASSGFHRGYLAAGNEARAYFKARKTAEWLASKGFPNAWDREVAKATAAIEKRWARFIRKASP